MVINNFKEDFKKLQQASGATQTSIASKTGIAQPNVAKTFSGKIIPEKFAAVCEAMGYDVKVVYVKRGVN